MNVLTLPRAWGNLPLYSIDCFLNGFTTIRYGYFIRYQYADRTGNQGVRQGGARLEDRSALLTKPKKLTLLLQYRDDYTARLQDNQAQGLSIEGYRNFQVFLDKLEQAIAGQQQIVQESNRRKERKSAHLASSRTQAPVLRHAS